MRAPFRSSGLPSRVKRNIPGVMALGVLSLLAVALVRRRFRLGYVLLHVAVALAERWRDQRAKARLGKVLATMPPSSTRPEGELWRNKA